MPDQTAANARTGAFFRIDRFIVPETAREEFLSRVRQTHELLADQPGFIRDHIVERAVEGAASEIVTVAEWESEAAVARAKLAVQAMHRQTGFDPGSMFERLGIRAEIGN
jgi:heme-degrading monooxygenase HmoA